jgi:cytochrome c
MDIWRNTLLPLRVPLQGHTFRYGGLHASHRDRWASLLHIPDPAVVVGRVPGGARGSRRRLGAIDINNACRTCHTTKEGDNRLGPNLHNIIGRKAGSLPTFGYSSAMKGADFVWDKEKLDGFIAKPDEVVPGNNMKPYGGLASAEDRTKLITFLQSPTVD